MLEKTLESPLDCKEIQPVHPKGNQSWIFIGRTDAEAETPNTSATWCKELTHWKRPWCWETLKARGEGDDSWWDGWMASLTQWTRVWVNSGSSWGTGRPGMLQSMGSQRVDTTERLNWTCIKCSLGISNFLEDLVSFIFYYFPLFLCIDHQEGFPISPCYSLELCIQMGFAHLLLAFCFSSLVSCL